MAWIVCWIKGHVWRNDGAALSHPYHWQQTKSCQRCCKRERIVTTIGR
jgi:hypothetical protein